jgi:hypothetical protein
LDETYRTRSWRSTTRRSSAGRRPAADRSDPWTESWDTFVTPAMESWTRMWNDALDATRAPEKTEHHAGKHGHHDPCGCGRREDHGCKDVCQCCIGKADIVLYAYPGERRIIPLAIENSIRREREVTLELSGFDNTRKCPVAVSASLLGEKTLKLAPCSEHEVLVAVQIGEANPNSTTGIPGVVTECCVQYADLRITGCDIRPVRIAVAVLPFECDRYTFDCTCGCC